MIRTLIVSDIRLYREGLQETLRSAGRYEVVAAVATSAEALIALAGTPAEVTLVDLVMTDAIATVREIVGTTSLTAVIALAVRDDAREIIACAEAGAVGYVTRDESVADLLAAIDHATRGELRCTPRIAACLFRQISALSSGQVRPGACNGLSARESEVLHLIGAGLCNKDVARLLGIELSTVKNHVHNLLGKLNVSSRGEAAALARVARRPRPWSSLDPDPRNVPNWIQGRPSHPYEARNPDPPEPTFADSSGCSGRRAGEHSRTI
jgi:two-component system nitrate/nitrite response regulator NarL